MSSLPYFVLLTCLDTPRSIVKTTSRTMKVIETAMVLPPMYSALYSGDPTGHLENDLVDVDAISQCELSMNRLEVSVVKKSLAIFSEVGLRSVCMSLRCAACYLQGFMGEGSIWDR